MTSSVESLDLLLGIHNICRYAVLQLPSDIITRQTDSMGSHPKSLSEMSRSRPLDLIVREVMPNTYLQTKLGENSAFSVFGWTFRNQYVQFLLEIQDNLSESLLYQYSRTENEAANPPAILKLTMRSTILRIPFVPDFRKALGVRLQSFQRNKWISLASGQMLNDCIFHLTAILTALLRKVYRYVYWRNWRTFSSCEVA